MRRERGYALPFVLTVLILLGMGASLVMYVLTAGVAEKRRGLGELRAFYACDSAIRLASRIAEQVALENPLLPGDEVTQKVMDKICTEAGGCLGTRLPNGTPFSPGPATYPGYPFVAEYRAGAPGDIVGPDAFMPPSANMEHFSVRVRPLQNVTTIQNGAFRDLFSIQSTVQIETQGIDTVTGTVAHARDKFSIGTVAPFQLMLFSNVRQDWEASRPRSPLPLPLGMDLSRMGPSAYVDGPFTARGPLRLTRAVSTGAQSFIAARVWDGDTAAPAFSVTATDGVWATRINKSLKLPSSPGRRQVTAAELALEPNTTRWLLDPVITTGPSPDGGRAADAKLAGQADIRIIDGIWFIKPPIGSSVPQWPGIPVWSDHPGANVQLARAETQALVDPVGTGRFGQQDIRVARSLADMPERYSYYETGRAGTSDLTMNATNRDGSRNTGIVSYGLLKYVGGTDELIPGAPGKATPRSASQTPLTPNAPCGNITSISKRFHYWTLVAAAVPPMAANVLCPNPTGALMDATRYGFNDNNLAAAPNGRVLPMNFDVERFLEALQDGRPGELGSYFCGATVDVNDQDDFPAAGCRLFNGIVYVTASWPGSLDGLINTLPAAAPPDPGRVGTSSTPPATGVTGYGVPPVANGFPIGTFSGQMYAPEQLCADRTDVPITDSTIGMRTIKCDSTAGSAWSQVYRGAGAIPGVTALRIVDGQNLAGKMIGAQVPKRYGGAHGLTIASNLPVYVYGRYNQPTATPFAGGPPGRPKALIAGDRVTFLSVAHADARPATATTPSTSAGWSDGFMQWYLTPVVFAPINKPRAAPTEYWTAIMVGANPASSSQTDAERNVRVLENWDATTELALNGAIFVAGRAVYRTDPQSAAYPIPNLKWQYYPSLSTLNQPPGTPRFLTGVSTRWRDLRDLN